MIAEHLWLLFEVTSIATGLWLAVSGIHTQISRRKRRALLGPTELLGLARSFRRVVGGLALIGIGAGLLADISWLVTLSLIIGGEELLESSVMAAVLRDEEKRRAAEVLAPSVRQPAGRRTRSFEPYAPPDPLNNQARI